MEIYRYIIVSTLIHVSLGAYSFSLLSNKSKKISPDVLTVNLVEVKQRKIKIPIKEDIRKAAPEKKSDKKIYSANLHKERARLSSRRLSSENNSVRKNKRALVSPVPFLKTKEDSLAAEKKKTERHRVASVVDIVPQKKIKVIKREESEIIEQEKDVFEEVGQLEEEETPIPLDTDDSRYSDYFSGIKSRIAFRWSYPEEAAMLGLYGKLRLKFLINNRGNLSGISIVDSSGHTILDDEAMSAVKEASPYSPIPDNINKDQLSIIVTFNYFPSYDVVP